MAKINVPNCFTNDCDCNGTPPPPGPVLCNPLTCAGPKCCCCDSINIVLSIRSRIFKRVFYSCNKDGTGPGQTDGNGNEVLFPPGCTSCTDACNRALGGSVACSSITQPAPGWSPPDWLDFPAPFGPCECTCAELVDPGNPSAGCNLTCVTCPGLQCNAEIEVLSGSCSYQFNALPGGCCGTPAFVDAVFVLDYSGSMDPFINSVIDDVGSLVSELAATGGQARFGLIVYGKATNDVTINTFTNGQILTTDVDDFKARLQANLPTSGGQEPDFEATEIALSTYPWTGVENLLFLIGDEKVDGGGALPIQGGLGDPDGQPSAAILIELANTLNVTVYTVQHMAPHIRYDSRKTDLAFGTNGQDLEITQSFASILGGLDLNVFGASCDCLDQTSISIQLCTGGVDINGVCVDPEPDIPIGKCFNEDNSDCHCNDPLTFDLNGEIITILPDPDTLNLVCCGELEGGGCSCPSGENCEEGCCGILCGDFDICRDFEGSTLQAAIDAIWCSCYHNDGATVVTAGCNQCTIPDPDDPEYDQLDIQALTECELKFCDGQGGFFSRTRPEVVAEVTAAWANCQGPDEPPPPPPISEASCLPECDRADECIIGDLECSTDIWECRQTACSNSATGCVSTRNPATIILNNGIGLVAYESMSDNTVIKIDQFHTSVPAKILPNRKTNYGRLQHSLRWADGTDSATKLVKMYYFNPISSHFMNGISGVPAEGTVVDMIVFQSGPFQNQCFSLDINPIGPVDPEVDEIGNFIRFTVPIDVALSNPFPSLDDVYDIEWFIVDSDDAGLTGSAVENAATPGSNFLLTTNTVNTKLQLSPHVHDGAPVPVANPSLAVAHNYMNATENSHFVYLVYQALENDKWNLYMRQLRLSEYSRENIVVPTSMESLVGLGISEVIYRVICTNDECSIFGNDFLVKRSVTMEIVLEDGRDVFNGNLLDVPESWAICSGSPAGSFPKKRVFAELVHSAITNKCPDQFEFNDLFFNWEIGDEFSAPITTPPATLLFSLLQKPNDDSMEITENTQTISGITITSSQVGAVWFDDQPADWKALDSAALQQSLQFKGIDVSEPIPITEFETGHCSHPIVSVNHNNDVFVVYECTDPLLHQIHIVGTAVPSTSLPLGILNPRNIDTTLDYFFAPDDFRYRANITKSGEGTNQFPDMYIDANDKIHVTWQTNRDNNGENLNLENQKIGTSINYWEIYYANSEESFAPKRITNFQSKSLKPSIAGDIRGNLHIAWHDDRFGNWEILMAYRDDERIETLSEQDPYLAGVRNEGYSHSADIIPLVLTNPNTTALCLSSLSVRFFEDRLETMTAFDVAQSDFPMAFQVPGLKNDRTTATFDAADIASWERFDLTLSSGGGGGGVALDTFRPHQFQTGNGTGIDGIDTGLAGSAFETVSITWGAPPSLGKLPRFVIFLAGETPVLRGDDPTWTITKWVRLAHGSGVEFNVKDLMDSFSIEDSYPRILTSPASTVFSPPSGRYKAVILGLADGTPIGIVSQVKINSIQVDRVCLSPGETTTAFLDLTPSIRVDKLGKEVTEMPLPIAARKNKVYFIGVSGTDDSGQTVTFADQKRSISCESCSGTVDAWDFTSCTFPIIFNNEPDDEVGFFNARVRFYADLEKRNLVAQFDAFFGTDGNLECFTTDDNIPAQNSWQSAGLEVDSRKQRSLTLWPMLSNTAGLLCGIKYWVETEICEGTAESPCTRTDLLSSSVVSWVCDCASPRWTGRFGDAPINIRNLLRWRSSGDGFADTRLTETGMVNNLNPTIHIRSDLTGLVLYESNRDGNCPGGQCSVDGVCIGGSRNELECNEDLAVNQVHTIYATAFSIFPGLNMYASGAEAITTIAGELLIRSDIPVNACDGTNCDDGEAAIEGRNIAFSLDQYDNIFLAAEKQHDQFKCEELTQDKQQSIMVHRCGVRAKNLHFIPEEVEGAGVFACNPEKILGKTAPLITDKTFKSIIKLARVNNKFASYHITRAKRPSAVVEQCNIFIDVITEPDTIAVRLRNEQGSWSTWFPIDPEITEYTISVPWVLSPGSGLKSVEIEAATYQGLSASSVITIIADYKGISHSVKFYKSNIGVPGSEQLSGSDLLSRIDSNQAVFVASNILPNLEGLPVAGIRQPEVVDSVIVKDSGVLVFIELIPPKEYLETIDLTDSKNFPLFDVLQQGDQDLFALPTVFNAEENLFQGAFQIRIDNMSSAQDGLSFLIPHFKNDCSDLASEIVATTQYIRDKFNDPIASGSRSVSPTDVSSTTTDVWANERDEFGRIKHRLDIRGSEDPYFVFGDPNYRLKKQHE